MSGLAPDFTDANVTGLAEYFVRKFNLISSKSEYQKEQENEVPPDFSTPQKK